MNQNIRFKLSILPEQYLEYYKGHASNVLVISEDGRKVRFPAIEIKPFLTREGIHGYFEISFDKNNKFVSLNKIAN